MDTAVHEVSAFPNTRADFSPSERLGELVGGVSTSLDATVDHALSAVSDTLRSATAAASEEGGRVLEQAQVRLERGRERSGDQNSQMWFSTLRCPWVRDPAHAVPLTPFVHATNARCPRPCHVLTAVRRRREGAIQRVREPLVWRAEG